MAAYAMSLFALGLSKNIALLADPERDSSGMLLDTEHLPRRVHAPKVPK